MTVRKLAALAAVLSTLLVLPPAHAVPGRGTLFGTDASGGNLITINPVTGAGTVVGDTGLGFAAFGGLDFSSDGTLFAAVNIAGNGGTGSDHLATIDTATGAATVIGPFGGCTD